MRNTFEVKKLKKWSFKLPKPSRRRGKYFICSTHVTLPQTVQLPGDGLARHPSRRHRPSVYRCIFQSWWNAGCSVWESHESQGNSMECEKRRCKRRSAQRRKGSLQASRPDGCVAIVSLCCLKVPDHAFSVVTQECGISYSLQTCWKIYMSAVDKYDFIACTLPFAGFSSYSHKRNTLPNLATRRSSKIFFLAIWLFSALTRRILTSYALEGKMVFTSGG